MQSYIVYLGSHSHGPEATLADIERVTDSHYDLLGSFTERCLFCYIIFESFLICHGRINYESNLFVSFFISLTAKRRPRRKSFTHILKPSMALLQRLKRRKPQNLPVEIQFRHNFLYVK